MCSILFWKSCSFPTFSPNIFCWSTFFSYDLTRFLFLCFRGFLKIRPCPHENWFNHPNRFHPDLLCPNERCKIVLEPRWFSPASGLSNERNGLNEIGFIQNSFNQLLMKPIYMRLVRYPDRIQTGFCLVWTQPYKNFQYNVSQKLYFQKLYSKA